MKPAAAATRPVIVRLRNWVGDAILGVPALRLLQQHGLAPQLVGKGWAGALLAGEPWPVHARPGPLRERVRQLRELARQARATDAGFDARENALVLPTSFTAALEMRLAGLRAVGHAAEARSLLLARAVPRPAGAPEAPVHELVNYWTLACAFTGHAGPPPAHIALATRPADQAAADDLLLRAGVVPPFVVVCPFAGGLVDKQEKTWPRFVDFTRELLRRGHRVVACPGPGEDDIVAREHPGVLALPGVKMGVYGGVLRRAAVVVSNDTGPAHLAAAVGTPLVSVLGPTKPGQWAPWGPSVAVVRRWPGWPEVDEVMAAFERPPHRVPGP